MSTKPLEYYKSLEYTISIKREIDDSQIWYVAYCVEFGLNACHGIGDTPNKALESFFFEKDIFIEFLYNNGESIPEPIKDVSANYSGVLSLRTSTWIHSLLTDQAKANGVSINAYINQLLSYHLGSDIAFARCEEQIEKNTSMVNKKIDAISRRLFNISYKSDSIYDDIKTDNHNQGWSVKAG